MAVFKNENGTAAKKSGSSPNYDDNFAHVEPSVTASQAYSVGKFLVFNGRLYKVILPISQGDTLSVNSNIALTNVTDEFENITPPEAEEVEWSVWNEMTEAERDAYSAGKKLDIVNVPGADGTISADLMTLLWENPDPNVAFPAQTITLSSSDYDYLMILPKYNTTSHNYIPPLIVEKNLNGYIIFTDYSGANAASVFRGVSISNGTSVTFTLTNSNLSVYHQKDTLLLPWKIYGIKKTINIKFDAIASDVSTSADKCMLSDGETSVEDAITEKADKIPTADITITANNGETFASFLNRLYALIDFDKLSVRSVLMNSGGHVASLQLWQSTQCIFGNGYSSSTIVWNYGLSYLLRQTNSQYFALTNSGATDYSNTAATGTTLTLYY